MRPGVAQSATPALTASGTSAATALCCGAKRARVAAMLTFLAISALWGVWLAYLAFARRAASWPLPHRVALGVATVLVVVAAASHPVAGVAVVAVLIAPSVDRAYRAADARVRSWFGD